MKINLYILALTAFFSAACREPAQQIMSGPEAVVAGSSARITITSPAFIHNAPIPSKYTYDGQNVNPPLKFENIPDETKSLALIVDDNYAPGQVWVHWVVWKINPKALEIKENSVPVGAVQGMNTYGYPVYMGPSAPKGAGTHRYSFRGYALDIVLPLSAGAKPEDTEKAMEGHIIGKGELIGFYTR